jgi:hypothetical protein
MPDLRRTLFTLLLIVALSAAQETHRHCASKLGKVSFPISCTAAVQKQFDRGMEASVVRGVGNRETDNSFR